MGSVYDVRVRAPAGPGKTPSLHDLRFRFPSSPPAQVLSGDDEDDKSGERGARQIATMAGAQDMSPSSSGLGHNRDRSHFSIPDVMVTAVDEDGQPSHFEIQLEETARRAPLALISANRPSLSSGPRTAASAMIETPGSPKKPALAQGRSQTPQSAKTVKTSMLQRKKKPAAVKIPRDYTACTMSSSTVGSPTSPSAFSASSLESGSSEGSGSTGRTHRLRKGSLPRIFGRRERDAALAQAARDLPVSSSPQMPTRLSNDAVRIDQSSANGIRSKGHNQHSRYEQALVEDKSEQSVQHSAQSIPLELPIKPAAVLPRNAPNVKSKVKTEDRPPKEGSRFRSLTRQRSLPALSLLKGKRSDPNSKKSSPVDDDKELKRLRKAHLKQEEELMKEWERVDKMVRKYDAKAREDAKTPAEDSRRKGLRGGSSKSTEDGRTSRSSQDVCSAFDLDPQSSPETDAGSNVMDDFATSALVRSSSEIAELCCSPENDCLALHDADSTFGSEVRGSRQTPPRERASKGQTQSTRKLQQAPQDGILGQNCRPLHQHAAQWSPPSSPTSVTTVFESLYRNIEDMEHSFARRCSSDAERRREPSAFESERRFEGQSSQLMDRHAVESAGNFAPDPHRLPTVSPSLSTSDSEMTLEELTRVLLSSNDSDFNLAKRLQVRREHEQGVGQAPSYIHEDTQSNPSGSAPTSAENTTIMSAPELLCSADTSIDSSESTPLTPPQTRLFSLQQARGPKQSAECNSQQDWSSTTENVFPSIDDISRAFPLTPPREALPPSPPRKSSKVPAIKTARTQNMRVGAHPSGFSFPRRTRE